ncbi:Uncharacterised protein [uncultured Clostridium sp.]|uniref:Amidohydrolase family protein n=1 Tax=Muricoprocola aceti TaxID=2981772 RepID=A0ABT2SMF3_9FIRM|nr:amidohydrolase family protein [Muricoprocola aceti]MCU6725697.1 amidohydrolase family protein [Muricoprocola aceti]MDD7436042.1 amidohydrolase family protein [Lachnospiraceae bacterium]SCH60838.1 Uncharacterised protein [uncultured Clostridium sp.]
MFGECHAHLFMNGTDYRQAVRDHKNSVNISKVREELTAYQTNGITFVRDGGDKYGVSELARELAPEYDIEYRTPIFAIHRKGHYGGIVGKAAETLKEYADLVAEVKCRKGDFIKIMVSGIMEYEEFGRLSEPGLEEEWIREMIHIAHEEGMAVMVHGNGRDAVLAAVEAGADSIEHGNYIDTECLDAMAESDCVWVPTIVTTGALLGCGRYPEQVLEQIYEKECENLAYGYGKGVNIAAGSDAGAYLVPHGDGILWERKILVETLTNLGYNEAGVKERIWLGESQIREHFCKK